MRAGWRRRIEVFSPKLERRLSLGSRDAWRLWLVLEANPTVASFCERGGRSIEAFLKLRRAQAPKQRRAASDIARVQRDRAKPLAEVAPAPSAPAQRAQGEVKGRRLRIARGFGR